VNVRDAVAADAAALAGIQVTTWRTAYAGMIPDDILAGLSEAEHRARWETWLPVAPPAFCLVAGSPPVGFVSGGHLGDGPEVYALYVAPSAWRRGAGRSLLAAALDRLRAAGGTTAGLWVLRDNARAQSFYEALGWTPTGEARLEEMHGVDLPVVRYVTPLDQA
jgi:ribosomal protein S18 acetylase RimI-like enzyme